MSHTIFPLAFANENVRLLTGLVLGFFFGFSLERGGFGNARKLAAQFYLYDMAVFKVMFTAIIVAMVGLYTLVNLGLFDLEMLYINPTFMWAQLLGGFIMGIGFLMSGLCPGTSVVSAASGRWDGLMTFLGIAVGSLVFMLAVSWVPGVQALYGGGSLGTSFLYGVLHLPPLVLAFAVVVVAALGFLGAEKLEEVFSRKYGVVELTPPKRPAAKFVLPVALTALAVVGIALQRGPEPLRPAGATALAPLDLARDLIEGRPGLLVLDLRDGASKEERIPHSYPATSPEAVKQLLATAPMDATVVLVGDGAEAPTVQSDWPRTVHYAYLEGGFGGWKEQVLTPARPGSSLADREQAAVHDQITAYFTGATLSAAPVPAPPPLLQTGAQKKAKKGGGC